MEERAEDRECCTLSNKGIFRGHFKQEIKSIFLLSWGLVLTNFSEMFLPTLSTVFLGHVGELELSAAALSNGMLNILCVPVILGLTTSCDTYFSQACGAGRSETLGIILQKSFAVVFLVLIFVSGIFINATSLLLLLGFPETLSQMTGDFMTAYIPGMFGLATFIILSKYMAVQKQVIPSVIIVFLGICVCALVNFILVTNLGLGVIGAAMGQNCAGIFMASAAICYIYFSKMFAYTWTGWSWNMLAGWGPFFVLGIKGMFLITVEFSIWVILVVAAGYIGNVELGAQEVFYNVQAIFASLGLGVSDAAAIRVGQELGAGNTEMVTVVSRVCYVFVGSVGSIMVIAITALKYQLPKLYTDIPSVLELAVRLMPLDGLLVLFGSLSYIGQGIFRGAGFQGKGLIIIGVTYYIFALPSSLCVMFLTPYSTFGGWVVLLIAIIIVSVTFLVCENYVINWKNAAKKAKHRISNDTDDNESQEEVSDVTESEALIDRTRETKQLDFDLSSSLSFRDKKLLKKRVLTAGAMLVYLITCIIIRLVVISPHQLHDTTSTNSTSAYNASSSATRTNFISTYFNTSLSDI